MASAWEGRGWSWGWSWAEVAQRLLLRKQDDGQFRAMSASCVLGRPDLGPNGWVDGWVASLGRVQERLVLGWAGDAIPCRWRARSSTTRSMPALGRGRYRDLRPATSVSASGSGRVGRGRSCPGSHATVDGWHGGIRDCFRQRLARWRRVMVL